MVLCDGGVLRLQGEARSFNPKHTWSRRCLLWLASWNFMTRECQVMKCKYWASWRESQGTLPSMRGRIAEDVTENRKRKWHQEVRVRQVDVSPLLSAVCWSQIGLKHHYMSRILTANHPRFPVHCCLLGHNIPDFLQIYDHFFTLFFKVTTWFWSCKTCSLLLLTQFIKWQQNAGNSVLESAHICMPVCLCCTQWRMALSLSCLSVMNNLPRRCRSH